MVPKFVMSNSKAIYDKQKYLRIQGTYPEVSRKMTLQTSNFNIEKFWSNLVNPITYRPTIHASQIESLRSPNFTNFFIGKLETIISN